MAASTPLTFTPFPRLPPELRLLIWEAAIPQTPQPTTYHTKVLVDFISPDHELKYYVRYDSGSSPSIQAHFTTLCTLRMTCRTAAHAVESLYKRQYTPQLKLHSLPHPVRPSSDLVIVSTKMVGKIPLFYPELVARLPPQPLSRVALRWRDTPYKHATELMLLTRAFTTFHRLASIWDKSALTALYVLVSPKQLRRALKLPWEIPLDGGGEVTFLTKRAGGEQQTLTRFLDNYKHDVARGPGKDAVVIRNGDKTYFELDAETVTEAGGLRAPADILCKGQLLVGCESQERGWHDGTEGNSTRCMFLSWK